MAGELIAGPNQWQVRDLLMGFGTDWVQSSQDGRGLPDGRFGDIDRPEGGQWPGTDRHGGRTITATVHTQSGDPAVLMDRRDEMVAAFDLADDDLGLKDVPLAASDYDGSVWLLWGRPRRCAIDESDLAAGELHATWQYKAHDPYWYSATLKTVTLDAPVSSAGRTYPRTYPMAYGGGDSGIVVATNAGKARTWPTWYVQGPKVNPRLENVTTGRTLRLAIDVQAGQTLIVDFHERTVLLNGTADRYQAIVEDDWWPLAKGDNSLRLGADSGAGGAIVQWRDAKL